LTQGINPVEWVGAFGHVLTRDGLDLKFKKWMESPEYKEAIKDNVFYNSKGVRDFLPNEWLYDPEMKSPLLQKTEAFFEKKGIRHLKTGADVLQFLGQTMEETTRLASYRKDKKSLMKQGKSAADAGYRAAKTSTELMKFGEAGDLPRTLGNLGVNYATIPYQVTAANIRAIKKNPAKYLFRVSLVIGAPALLEYLLYKDDEEWKGMPDYVRLGSVMFRDGVFRGKPNEGNWIAVRIPEEVGRYVRPAIWATAGQDSQKLDILNRAKETAKDFAPSIPGLLAFVGQSMFHDNTGGVIDMRFYNLRKYPLKDWNDRWKKMNEEWGDNETKFTDQVIKNKYDQSVQQVDTVFGSSGRYLIRKWTYLQDQNLPEEKRREKRDPSLFQRFRPEPPDADKQARN
jgi:hypothetical protein